MRIPGGVKECRRTPQRTVNPSSPRSGRSGAPSSRVPEPAFRAPVVDGDAGGFPIERTCSHGRPIRTGSSGTRLRLYAGPHAIRAHKHPRSRAAFLLASLLVFSSTGCEVMAIPDCVRSRADFVSDRAGTPQNNVLGVANMPTNGFKTWRDGTSRRTSRIPNGTDSSTARRIRSCS